MAWISLIIAGICEMFGATMMIKLHRARNWQSLVLLFVGFAASFLFLAIAMKSLPMALLMRSDGIGTAGGAIIGMLFYGDA